MQARFAKEIFTLCKKEGINTCLDTSGIILNSDVRELLQVTDLVLLDIKYTSDALYKENVDIVFPADVEKGWLYVEVYSVIEGREDHQFAGLDFYFERVGDPEHRVPFNAAFVNEYEVVGNIFDNKELLKVEE